MTDQTIPPGENPAETMRKVMQDLGEVEILTDLTVGAVEPKIVSVPNGRMVQDLSDQFRKAEEFFSPLRRRGTATLRTLDSLIDWGNRNKDAGSVLFANNQPGEASLTCIADYHFAGEATIDTTGDPLARHGAHRGLYKFPLSKEWKAWRQISDQPLDKDAMGEFIETRQLDVMDPSPALIALDTSKAQGGEVSLIETAQKIGGRYGQLQQLLALSRHFQVYETANLEVKSDRDTGAQSVQFLNEHNDKDGKPIKLPTLIIIAIPVFEGGPLYRLPVRFRYRKSGASVKFIFTLYAPERAFDDAFQEAVDRAAEATGLPLFIGTPES